MALGDHFRSHIQLIVPMQYQFAGRIFSTANGRETLFDGNPDTYYAQTGTDTSIYLEFERNLTPQWVYIYNHHGSMTGAYGIYLDSTSTGNTGQWEEFIGQATRQWTQSSGTHYRISGQTARSSLLLDLDLSGSDYYDLKWRPIATTGSPVVHGIIFSDDFQVPMYNQNWNCERTFKTGIGANIAGIVTDNLVYWENKQMKITHSFEWGGLSGDELDVFERFLAAFGGQISQPFVMAEIINDSDYAYPVMVSRWLIIEPNSVQVGITKDGEREVKFAAREFRESLYHPGMYD